MAAIVDHAGGLGVAVDRITALDAIVPIRPDGMGLAIPSALEAAANEESSLAVFSKPSSRGLDL